MSKTVKLPLQDMVSSVIKAATEKLAADEKEQEKAKKLISYEKKEHGGKIPSVSEEEAEKTASLTDPDYIEKLASATDYIASHIDEIEQEEQGVLQKALAKMAEKGSPAGAGKGPGALPVSAAIGGTQSHKKDKPKTEDAAASQAGSSLSAGGLPGGKTQVDNNMHDAPGGGALKPSGTYPAQGVLKAASVRGRYIAALTKSAEEDTKEPEEKSKTASELAREIILQKLAGEDVMKASISGGGTTSPLAGKGQLKTTQAGESSPSQAGDPVSGMGNQGRKHIASNAAAISMTKGEAKGPQKTQLGQVLDEPALSPKTDTVLKQNLRNTGKAGVKIAAARAFLEKIASEGCTCDSKGECSYCKMKAAAKKVESGQEKKAMSPMSSGSMGGAPPTSMGGGGGGMSAMATAGAGADGCTCGNTGECRVCKLKAALAAAKAGPGGGTPVEKDSMGDQQMAPAY